MEKATIYITGKIGEEATLLDVIRQFKSFENPTEVEVFIHSQGGNVTEGESIYNYLVALDKETPVTTITDKAFSIAAKIFAAGSTRKIESIDNALMIHFAWATVDGNAEKLEYYAETLREIEKDFISFYSNFLDIDKDTVSNLLAKETSVSGQEAVELGFATETMTTATAFAEFPQNKIKMKKETKKSLKERFLAWLDKEEEVEAKAELILQDSNSIEVNFPDLEEGDVVKVGDKAKIDGSAIADGSRIMPSIEEATLVFEGGAVVEIIEKEVEEVPTEEEVEVEAKAEEIKEISVWSVEVSNSSFNIGEVVKYQGIDGEEYPVSASEFRLADGSGIVTDATGIIVKIKPVEEIAEETEEEPVVLEAEASFEEVLEKVSSKIKAEVKAELSEQLAEKDKEIIALKKRVNSPEIKAEEKSGTPAAKEGKLSKGEKAARYLKYAKK